MKSKKIVAILVIVAMLFAVIAIVAACDDTHECDNKCDKCGGCLTTGCNHEDCANKCQGHVAEEVEDNNDNDSDDDDTDTAPTTEVTAEEWATALSKEALSNVSVSLSNGLITLEAKLDLDNNVYYYTFADGQRFYSIENSVYYKYEKLQNDASYVKNESNQEEYDSVWLMFYPLLVSTLTDKYSEFTYNEQTSTYVAESIMLDELDLEIGIELTFKNGTLICSDFDVGDGMHLLGEFSNYGATTVTLPDNYTESNQ